MLADKLQGLGRVAAGGHADGWRPDEPTSWEALRGALRFRIGYRPGFLRSERVWESVAVRLRRLVPRETSRR